LLIQNSIGFRYVYSYDQASNLTSEVDDGVTTSYAYDPSNQLTSVTTAGSSTVSYSYDATGNRTDTGDVTGPGNQLINDGTWTYTYDAEGNLVEKSQGPMADTWTYGYDNDNRLIWAQETSQAGGGTLLALATYTYDINGNLLEEDEYTQTAGITTVTRHAYDGANAWADLSSTNTLEMRRIYLPGADQMLARVDSSGNLAWYGTDHLGSVRDVINAAGTMVLDQINYDAFGNVTSESSPTNGDAYKYAGYTWDAVTGQYKAGAREDDPVTDRWTTEDPLGLKPDTNPYRNVGNNPTNYTDPSGEITKAAELVYFAKLKELSSGFWGGFIKSSIKYQIASEEAFKVEKSIGPYAIKFAAQEALKKLGYDGIDVQLGDWVKASISCDDFEKLRAKAGESLKPATTISAEKAFSIALDKNFELKIYLMNGQYRIAVGTKTESWEHYFQAVEFLGSFGGKMGPTPNTTNAEAYLGKPVFNDSTAKILANLLKEGWLSQKDYNSILADGIEIELN
jgi:RHS repeat-associated protein